MTDAGHSGGCQCGAVRYHCEALGRATICHCRMCQKAFGGFFGPLVTARGLTWTRGGPDHFASSSKVRRGFCSKCGTQLTYDWGGEPEVAIGTLDDPEQAAPVLQVNPADMLSFFGRLHDLPLRTASENTQAAAFMADIVSFQHPDHDTGQWPQEQAGENGRD